MNRTPFYDHHKASGARLIDFGGWEMPVQFAGILAEHAAVRERCGLFDIAHMGQVDVSGQDAFAFLQKVTTNDVSRLQDGQGQYSLLCREDGAVVDDLYVYRLREGAYFLVVNASRRAVDLMWLKDHARGDVRITERSGAAAAALQGPLARDLIKPFFLAAASLKKNEVMPLTWGGGEFLLAQTGYTGEDGFEIFGETRPFLRLYEELVRAGAALCGLGARDTLRLEMGYRLYGNDLDEQHTALEAGLGWVVKLDKGDFVGRDHLLREKGKGPRRRLVAFRLKERGVPRHGCAITFHGGPAGETTSGTFSPSLQAGIGLGYVESAVYPKDFEKGPGLAVKIHGREVPADAADLPFYKKAVSAAK